MTGHVSATIFPTTHSVSAVATHHAPPSQSTSKKDKTPTSKDKITTSIKEQESKVLKDEFDLGKKEEKLEEQAVVDSIKTDGQAAA